MIIMIMITIFDIMIPFLMLRECTAPKAGGGGEREPCGLCKGEGKQQETCNDVSAQIMTIRRCWMGFKIYVSALLSVLERVGAVELVLEQLRGGGEEEAEDM